MADRASRARQRGNSQAVRDLKKAALLPSEWVTLGHFSVGHLDKRIF